MRAMRAYTRLWVLGLVVAATSACGEDLGASGGDYGGYGGSGGSAGTLECLSSNECPTGWVCSEFGQCLPPQGPPGDGGVPEPAEAEFELSDPVSSLRFVYVAMTELDALAKIDGTTLAVTSLPVGERPKVVATAPDSDTAVVLDSINGTATIVRTSSEDDELSVFATLPNLNQLAIDPTGSYAVAWFDLNRAIAEAGGLDAAQVGSFQDVTILSLRPDAPGAVDLTVGFRPRHTFFDTTGTRAYIVTEDGISVIDLASATQNGPSIVAPIPVTDDPFSDPEMLEIQVGASGEHAVVRQTDLAAVRIVDLLGEGAGSLTEIPLPSAPTDIDLSLDGSRAYAVLRDTAHLAIIDVPEDALNPDSIELIELGNVVAGSLILSADGSRGALFTNATAREEVTIVDLADSAYPVSTWPLQKSIRTAKFDPSGQALMIIHAREPGDLDAAATFEEFVDRSYGYSLFDVETGFAKLQLTPVDPGALAFAGSVPKAYVILDGGDEEGAVAQVQLIELNTGVVRTVTLGSPPEAVGILPEAGMAFVSQRHPLGRVSFMSITDDSMRTITGFDLNGRIVD